MIDIPMISTDYPDPSSASACRTHHNRPAVPLLALAPPALALGEEILGAGDEETNVRDFWNFISRASDIVKDGERLENLAWRQWCRHRRDSGQSTSSTQSFHTRRISTSSSGTTGSSVYPMTPHLEEPPSPTMSATSPTSDRRTFGSALKLLMEEDQFIDWVSDAQRHLPPPTISVPDTPVAQLEIRLVEPTPVPSRVGSLGGSMSGAGLLGIVVPPRLTEEPEEQEIVEEDEETETDEEEADKPQPAKPVKAKSIPSTSKRKQGKFFLQSSPSKGSGSDTAASPNGTSATSPTLPNIPQPPSPTLSLSPAPYLPPKKAQHRRTSSGSSASVGGPAPVAAPVKKRSPAKRHVSLSTMRGRFGVEKRKAAELFAQKMEAEAADTAAAQEEEGWEDEDGEDYIEEEGDVEEDDAEPVKVQVQAEAKPAPQPEPAVPSIDKGKGREVEPEESDEDYETEEDGSEEEGEEAEGDWSDESPEISKAPVAPPSPCKRATYPQHHAGHHAPPVAPPIRRTSSSKSANAKASNSRNKSTSHLDLTGLFSRPSARRGSSSAAMPPPPAPTPLKDMSRKQRLAAQEERKRIEAELEAQKKREMFAKQHIFGPKPTQSEGLLSGIFKRGGSMVDLTAAAPQLTSPPLRASPTLVHLPTFSRSPVAPGGNALLRSKSAVAVPVQTGVSVTRTSPNRSRLNEVIASSDSAEIKTEVERPRRTSDRSDKTGSNERKPPAGVELESDDSSSEEDDYLATSSTQRKLAELAEKQARKGKGRSPEIDQIASMTGPSMPVPAQNGQGAVRFDVPGAVEPMTPTTRRRTIISREMSMSLRQNLLLEREKSSGGGKRRTSVGPSQHSRPPPITHTSHLPTRNLSTADLTQYQMGAPLARHRSETALHRQAMAAQQRQSPPTAGGQQQGQPPLSESPAALVHPQPHRTSSGSVIVMSGRRAPAHPLLNADRSNQTQVQGQNPSPGPDQPRRRTQPSVLGGFLRPLTRVGTPAAPPEESQRAIIGRAQSSANLTTTRREATSRGSPRSVEAPAMVRRSTAEGTSAGSETWRYEADRRRDLAKMPDSSYRVHGW